jgi:hypothetical protein
MTSMREQADGQRAVVRPRSAGSDRDPNPGLLQLHKTAGNRAVGQILRRPAEKQTGLRRADAVERFVRKAVAFFARNQDGGLTEYALYLGADVNTELERIGVPAVTVQIAKQDDGAAGQFFADSWQMVLHPLAFTKRPGVKTMGELTADEAALVAHTVYHEARHAEQHFRIARLQAAKGEETGLELEENVAKAAAAAPLTAQTGSAREFKEAKDWEAIEYGADAIYRQAVTTWLFEVRETLDLVRKADTANAADVRERVGRRIAGWVRRDGAGQYIRSHLASARARKATELAADIVGIDKALTQVQQVDGALTEAASPEVFKPLVEALIGLNRAVYTAYGRQPVEADAFEAGNAVLDAFSKPNQQ